MSDYLSFCTSVSGQADKPARHSRCCEMDEATPLNVVAFDNVCKLEVSLQEFLCCLGHQPPHVTRVSPFASIPLSTLASTNGTVLHFLHYSIPFISIPQNFQRTSHHLGETPSVSARVFPCPAKPGRSQSHFYLTLYITSSLISLLCFSQTVG